jgi:hypothetical protein
MQELCFFDTMPGQTSALTEKKKSSSCLIWLYSGANTINSTLVVIVAGPAPGACQGEMQELCFFDTTPGQTIALTEREKSSSSLIWLYS